MWYTHSPASSNQTKLTMRSGARSKKGYPSTLIKCVTSDLWPWPGRWNGSTEVPAPGWAARWLARFQTPPPPSPADKENRSWWKTKPGFLYMSWFNKTWNPDQRHPNHSTLLLKTNRAARSSVRGAAISKTAAVCSRVVITERMEIISQHYVLLSRVWDWKHEVLCRPARTPAPVIQHR